MRLGNRAHGEGTTTEGTTMARAKRYALDDQDHATILAALRFYQESGMGEPSNRSEAIHEIATNCGDVISLDADGIDELCERLNTGG